MQTFRKKRIEIFVEAPLLPKVTEQLDVARVSGYSVMPVIAGRGFDGIWSAAGQVGSANQMTYIVCIVDEARLNAVLSEVFSVIARQIGFIATSDVEVIRADRF